MSRFEVRPIGVFRCEQRHKHELPRQGVLAPDHCGWVELESQPGVEAMVADLAGFSHVWLVSWLDRAEGWKPKVRPPRGAQRRGLLATRSPHRPNPIGLTLVSLVRVEGAEIHVRGHDLLDGTPIVDVKPYVSYADQPVGEVRQGWLDEESPLAVYEIEWSARAARARAWLEAQGVSIESAVEAALATRPFPAASHRVKEREPATNETWKGEYAYRTWRVDFERSDSARRVRIEKIRTGYDEATLRGERESRWDDVELHVAFGRECFDQR